MNITTTDIVGWLSGQAPVVVLALVFLYVVVKRYDGLQKHYQESQKQHVDRLERMYAQYHEDSLAVAKAIEGQTRLLEMLAADKLER